MRELDFSIDLIIQPHYGTGVNSACNGKKYLESAWGKGVWHLRLTASLLPVS
jgi:hypothetical protein